MINKLIKGSLQFRSEKALGLFSKAISDLKQVNEQALSEEIKLEDKKLNLQLKIRDLKDIRRSNSLAISNIEKIFS